MKKTLVFVILFAIAGMQSGFSQTATNKDFFKGTWEVTVFGTPTGDSKMLVTLDRVEGKLTGELAGIDESSKVRYKKPNFSRYFDGSCWSRLVDG